MPAAVPDTTPVEQPERTAWQPDNPWVAPGKNELPRIRRHPPAAGALTGRAQSDRAAGRATLNIPLPPAGRLQLYSFF